MESDEDVRTRTGKSIAMHKANAALGMALFTGCMLVCFDAIMAVVVSFLAIRYGGLLWLAVLGAVGCLNWVIWRRLG
jgi:hypothetical protein